MASPYDLAPAEHILCAAIDDFLNNVPDDQTAVILMGENHAVPTHKMLQICAMNHLAKRQNNAPDDASKKFIFAHENAFNMMASTIKALNISLPDDLYYKLQDHDPHGRLALRSRMAFCRDPIAPISSDRVYKTAENLSIPTIFTDCARTAKGDGMFIDVNDPMLPKNKNIHSNIPVTSLEALKLRNQVMVERALQYASAHKTRIILQHCGTSHLYGTDIYEREYNDSLSAVYQKAGCATLGIFSPDFIISANQVDPVAWKNHSNDVILRGLSDETCRLDSRTDKYMVDEKTCLDTLVAAYSGENPCPFDMNDDRPNQNIVTRELRSLVEKASADTAAEKPHSGKSLYSRLKGLLDFPNIG